MQQVLQQLQRVQTLSPPILHFCREPAPLFDYQFGDFEFLHYNPQPSISAPIAV